MLGALEHFGDGLALDQRVQHEVGACQLPRAAAATQLPAARLLV